MPHFRMCAYVRVGVDELKLSLESPSVSETRVNRLPDGHFHRGIFLGEVLLQVMYYDDYLLGFLRF